MSPGVRRAPLLVLSCAALVLALGACDSGSGSDEGTSGKAAPGPSVIAPGKPGEAAETLSAADAMKRKGDDKPNSADFSYVQMMIEHHGQALEMTGLVAKRAASGKVKRLAERIASSQGPEIDAMDSWLKNNGGEREEKSSGHDHHAAMPGMASETQLTTLSSARGKAFDELFIKLMITHHEGAITMATDVLGQGNNVLVEEMANDVIAQQTSEIGRMRGMP
ncbi:DUF305 domain-containing protein [Streptomyces sp. NPDC058001]|uniref:DUF305 domain-containing protein n=1 Tax=Streptomyces sp. NPDC058001 TaxID=3346300 RepID=UPI0036E437D0